MNSEDDVWKGYNFEEDLIEDIHVSEIKLAKVLDDMLCNMLDIRAILRKHNLLDEPKDDEGTECTVRMIVDDTIEHLENIGGN